MRVALPWSAAPAMVAITLAVAGIPLESRASALKSSLTVIDTHACRQVRKHRDGGAWRCPGLPGYPVYFAEGDDRQMLSFGSIPERRRSATQTLTPFNTIFEGAPAARTRATIEWRVTADAKGQPRPFATIVRFHTAREGGKGEVLVITKVDAKVSCQLAVVDALANDDAMALAREWSDANARLLPCPQTPQVLGKAGRSPM